MRRRFFLRWSNARASGSKFGRDDDLAEDLAHVARQRLGQRTVADDDPAEGRLFVRGERLVPRLAQVGVGTDAARVGVLEDGDGRVFVLADELRGGGNVEDVVVGKLLAVELLEVFLEITVERRFLMRVLAVAKTADQRQREFVVRAGFRPRVASEIRGDGGIVGGGGLEDFQCQLLAQLERRVAVVAAHGREHAVVIGGVGHDRHEAVVLRRAAQHRRAADVDVFNRFLQRHVRFGDGFAERIQVDHEQVDGLNIVFARLPLVPGVVTQMEQAAVDARMERLDAARKNLGKPGKIRQVAHGDASVAQGPGGATGGEDFHTHFLRQRTGKGQQAGLVGEGDQGAGDFHGKDEG